MKEYSKLIIIILNQYIFNKFPFINFKTYIENECANIY